IVAPFSTYTRPFAVEAPVHGGPAPINGMALPMARLAGPSNSLTVSPFRIHPSICRHSARQSIAVADWRTFSSSRRISSTDINAQSRRQPDAFRHAVRQGYIVAGRASSIHDLQDRAAS
ncbi:MAG TPA: hypothetical protein PLX65_07175, partial [Accumulibacter sp.]|nr:hypothetical protein [Accumulibacter sp.]